MYKNLLVGADSSATALRAVEAAVELAELFGAKLHIVTAYKPETVKGLDLPEEFRYTANVHPADVLLDELKAMAKRASIPVEVHAATGEPAEAICRVAARIEADLVIVGNRGMRARGGYLGACRTRLPTRPLARS